MSTPIICATHPDCNAPSANTLGNHKCCTCKRFAHGVFCIKPVEVDDPSLSDIQHYFNQYESEGMTKEVCLLCIEKICGDPPAPPPAAVHPPAAAAAAATAAGAIDLEFYLSKTF